MDSIIFDIDGTLWDSRQVVADAWNEAVIEKTGRHPGFTPENITYLFGKTMTEIADCLFPDLPTEERRALGEHCFWMENERLKRISGDFYPGVLETIPKLAERYSLYIVSNCQAGYIEVVLKHSGLAKCFQDWMCFDDTKLPKSETLKALIRRNGLNDPIYVGDTQGDWEACKKAGIPMIFCAYGLGQVEDELPTIGRFEELKDLLK